MTTKEFIDMLEKADPSGEAHVRLPGGGVPIFAELKDGYWDGPYAFLDGNVYNISTKGYKVDIFVETPIDIVWKLHGDLEKLKNRFNHSYTYTIQEQIDERVNEFWKNIEKEAAVAREFHEKSLAKYTQKLLKIIEQKGIDQFHFNPKTSQWRGYNQGVEVHGQLCGGEINVIIETDLFVKTLDTSEKRIYEFK